MKAKSGKEVSAPAKWNTWLKKMAHTPSVAANDSTTVITSRTGATIARSSSMRISRITTSTIGMMRVRSCREAVCVSRLMALKPPTFASAPGIAARLFRRVVMVCSAASESDCSESVASNCTSPSTTTGAVAPDVGLSPVNGTTASMPGVFAMAAATSSAASAFAMMMAGLPAPAGKC